MGGFRGEEIPMMSIDTITKYLVFEQPSDPMLANVMIALQGRFKGEHKDEACHLVPIVTVTIKTRLKPELWVQIVIEAYG
jgi:hypothetical protein